MYIIVIFLIVYMDSTNGAFQSKLLECTNDTFVSIGDTIKLTCSVPGHTIRWLFRGSATGNEKVIHTGHRLKLTLGDRLSVEQQGKGPSNLTIRNATIADAGLYICRDMYTNVDVITEEITVTDGVLTNFDVSGSSPTAEHACAFQYHGPVRSTMELVGMDGTILVRTSDTNGSVELALNTSDRPCDRPRYCRVTFHFRNRSTCYIQIEHENSANCSEEYRYSRTAPVLTYRPTVSSPAVFDRLIVIGIGVAGATTLFVTVVIVVVAMSSRCHKHRKVSSVFDDETSRSKSFDSDQVLLPEKPNCKSAPVYDHLLPPNGQQSDTSDYTTLFFQS